jgi:hypothetical protein
MVNALHGNGARIKQQSSIRGAACARITAASKGLDYSFRNFRRCMFGKFAGHELFQGSEEMQIFLQ